MGIAFSGLLGSAGYMTSHTHPEITALREKPSLSVPTGPWSADEKETPIFQYFTTKEQDLDGLNSRFYGGEHGSLVGLMHERFTKFGDRKIVGWRELDHMEKTTIKDEKGNEKPWAVSHMSEVKYLSAVDFRDKMYNFGAGLLEVGAKAGDFVAIAEETRMEWMASIYGIWSQQMVGVTVYANLGEEALAFALEEAEVKVVVCSGSLVKKIIDASVNKPIIVHIDAIPEKDAADLPKDISIHAWEDVCSKGAAAIKNGRTKPNPPTSADDLALIMYTSGTTGNPKGVILSHGNVYASVMGFDGRLLTYVGEEEILDGSYVAYLPLAHILEFGAENVFLLRGSFVGYGHPRTLTSTACKPQGDLETYRPVFLVGVPRVFDTIKKAIEGKLPATGIKRAMFDRAFNDRVEGYKNGTYTNFYDNNVFKLPRATVGGRVKAIMSGGAPLSAATQEFLSVILGCFVGQGYGLTETGANGSIQSYWDLGSQDIGPVLESVQIKLVGVEGYACSKANPQGEIYIRGPPVAKGYFKQKQMTADSFTEDGWFKTGDVGQFTARGTLKIIGRVKALAKNAFGEYIALDTLESIYVQHPLAVPNGVCVIVESEKSYIAAIVCTNADNANKFAAANNFSNFKFPESLSDPKFSALVAKSFADHAKKSNRKPFELVKFVHVVADEWTPENGIMTAAHKLKRREIDNKYAAEIKELFKTE